MSRAEFLALVDARRIHGKPLIRQSPPPCQRPLRCQERQVIAERLSRRRDVLGVTVAQAAARCGCAMQTIAAVELASRHVSRAILASISEGLKLSHSGWLLEGIDGE